MFENIIKRISDNIIIIGVIGSISAFIGAFYHIFKDIRHNFRKKIDFQIFEKASRIVIKDFPFGSFVKERSDNIPFFKKMIYFSTRGEIYNYTNDKLFIEKILVYIKGANKGKYILFSGKDIGNIDSQETKKFSITEVQPPDDFMLEYFDNTSLDGYNDIRDYFTEKIGKKVYVKVILENRNKVIGKKKFSLKI